MARRVMTALLLGLLVAASAHAAAPPPRLSPERQRQLEEALRLQSLGVRLYRQGRLVEATRAFVRNLQICQALYPEKDYPRGHPSLATSLNVLGFLLRSQGEYGEALKYYRQALQMCQALYPSKDYPRGHAQLATTLNNLGFLFQLQGEYGEALKYHHQALRMRQALYPEKDYPRGHADLAQSLHNLGSLLHRQGEYGEALMYYRQALRMCQALYPKKDYPRGQADLAQSLNNLGLLLQRQGEYGEALKYVRQALQMHQALYPEKDYPRGHADLARSLNNLGSLLESQREYGEALKYYRQALQMCQALYPEVDYPRGHPSLAQSLNNLGLLLQRQGEYGEALKYVRQALQMHQALYPEKDYPRGHARLAQSLNNLGVLLDSQGECGEALKYHRRALRMYQALYPEKDYLRGHADLARSLNNVGGLLKAQGECGEALKYHRRALQMYQALAAQVAASAPEATALNHAASLPLIRDGYLSVTRDLPDVDAYPLVWQSRGAVMRVFERRHLAALAASSEGTRRLFADLLALRRRREHLVLAPAPKDTTRRDETLRELDERIGRLERELLPLLPALARSEELARSGPAQLQRALPAGAAFLDLLRYVRFDQDQSTPGIKGERRTPCYVGFVVRRDRVARVELGEAKDIDEAVRLWRQAIQEALPGQADRGLRHALRLRRLVWEPLARHLPAGVKTVYVAPDMALTGLPWAALPGALPGAVLLEEYALAVVPHGVFLLDRLTAPARRGEGEPALLAMGGVAYDRKPAAAGDLVATRGAVEAKKRLVWDYLKGTDREVRRLEELAAGRGLRLFAGERASVGRLLAELPAAGQAHLATHGFFADRSFRSVLQLDEKLFARREFVSGDLGERIGAGARSPLVLSGLVCSGANLEGTPARGILSADAIAGLDLRRLRLVVLSACDTGLGDVAGGEGVFGLQRAFHVAGARNVVASLWKVDDEATAALMTLFYQALWRGRGPLTPLEALRQAQLALYRHPGHIRAWSVGRGPNLQEVLPGSGEPAPAAPAAKRGAVKLWAAFVLSGPGDLGPVAPRSKR
jgi:CHAT domain-containing protein/Tfp pilus assembly protein PilF